MPQMQRIHVGTSGWYYDHWKGCFYPDNLSKNDFLEFYSRHFPTLEITHSFYQLPPGKLLSKLRDSVPDPFVFSVKANRYITYIKKLKDARASLAPFLKRMDILGDKLGPILFQLPPQWSCNCGRLEQFLKSLPPGRRYAFEFRDTGWFNSEVYDLLIAHNAALSIYQSGSKASPQVITADFVYVRLNGSKTMNRFDPRSLAEWAEKLVAIAAKGKELFCYFDGDQTCCPAREALYLKSLIESKQTGSKADPPEAKKIINRLNTPAFASACSDCR